MTMWAPVRKATQGVKEISEAALRRYYGIGYGGKGEKIARVL